MTKSITPFDVFLVPFLFSDLKTLKKRPCLVLARVEPSKLPGIYVVAMITSATGKLELPHDVTLKEYTEAGLAKESLVRLSKIVSLERGLLEKKLGHLTKRDSERVGHEFRELFQNLQHA